jgi:hypothetical protein
VKWDIESPFLQRAMLHHHVARVKIIAVNWADLLAVEVEDRQPFPYHVGNVDHHHGLTLCILFLHAWLLFLIAGTLVRLIGPVSSRLTLIVA